MNEEINDSDEKQCIAGQILRQLPDWFGIEAALTEYILGVSDKIFFAAFDGKQCLGFFSGEIHYQHTGELYVLGILPEHQGNGVGTALYQVLEQRFISEKCDTVLVKTLSERHLSSAYAQTRTFYKKQGFVPLIELPELWGAQNPCLLMEKSLKENKNR